MQYSESVEEQSSAAGRGGAGWGGAGGRAVEGTVPTKIYRRWW